ncbi:hypothetical protein [Mucilaginibacter lacusdianchii]|uniref:hypothetical protein n=1 Tax=Mucilaginibacter lacusdianchii TaxID=2684211 RepID=UPI00131D1E3B|nr:hypothetical protein [Mucilaginibacter sp. JXJ CY 39]
MKYIKLAAITCIISLFSCSSLKKEYSIQASSGVPVISFCDLPNYQNKQVYLKFAYSGMEEYWAIYPINPDLCARELKVELDFEEEKLPSKIGKAFAKVHRHYWNSYLIIEAIGIYETGKKGGYGHLGSNNSRFLVQKIKKISLAKKSK